MPVEVIVRMCIANAFQCMEEVPDGFIDGGDTYLLDVVRVYGADDVVRGERKFDLEYRTIAIEVASPVIVC